MTKNAERLATIFDALADVTVTVVADFLGPQCGGVPIALSLVDLGLTVFPVGAVGEDEAGQKVFDALHARHISTGGISKVKKYATPSPADAGTERLYGEHPVLLNLVENARKFAPASEVMYVCDYGIGAASPRILNFIKSNRCMADKVLAARSHTRLVDFEQITTAIATVEEMEKAIGISITQDSQKVAVAGAGMMQELKAQSFLAIASDRIVAFEGKHRPAIVPLSKPVSSDEVDILGAVFAAALSTGADIAECATLAHTVTTTASHRPASSKRLHREDVLAALSGPSSARRAR